MFFSMILRTASHYLFANFLFFCLVRTSNSEGLFQFFTQSGAKCWGFERNCSIEQSYSKNHIRCTKRSTWSSVTTTEQQEEMFWKAGDFGSLKERHASMTSICESDGDLRSSFLECSDHLRFCRAKNIFFNFRHLHAEISSRYRTDVIQKGDVGGHCFGGFHADKLQTRADETGYLQSWAAELKHFHSIPSFDIALNASCDVVFERPTFVVKLDAAVNMYHHFCDFVNLFASQFLNNTSFGRDVDVLWWDTYSGGFVDPIFGVTWQAFTNRKPFELVKFDGKKVCFRNVIFPLLARQIFGLYYNMPLVDECEGSGLFHAFSHHLLNRLEISQDVPLLGKVRITFLERKTQFRRVLNVNKLVEAIQNFPNVDVKTVSFDSKISFTDQLKIVHNSDIFIGMHGSGLTHLLFLPDWAAMFELYNCGDEHCYKDLARLRGVKYWTWKRAEKIHPQDPGRHPETGAPHQKFTNYAFDVVEFERIVGQIVEYVRRHPGFVERQRRLRREIIARNSAENTPKNYEL